MLVAAHLSYHSNNRATVRYLTSSRSNAESVRSSKPSVASQSEATLGPMIVVRSTL